MSDARWRVALKRINIDMRGLQASGFPIMAADGDAELNIRNWYTVMKGPSGTPYEGGEWRVGFTFTDQFPFKNPSVGFIDKILHPNVDWASGSVCLDALSKEWSPITSLTSVVEVLLPSLLSMPNPEDPLNLKAAHAFKSNRAAYEADVRRLVAAHAFRYTPPAAAAVAVATTAPTGAARVADGRGSGGASAGAGVSGGASGNTGATAGEGAGAGAGAEVDASAGAHAAADMSDVDDL